MSQTNNNDNTTVQEVEIGDLADILGTGVSSIMTPADANAGTGGTERRNVFTPMRPDTSFLDKPIVAQQNEPAEGDDPDGDGDNPDPAASTTPDSTDDPLAIPGEGTTNANDTPDDDKNKGGRPTAAVGALKSLIDKKLILPFDDGKKIEEYSQADYEELLEANMEKMRSDFEENLSQQFFSSLPPELQRAYQYVANGGTDMKGLFQSLASSQEIQALDTSTEQGQIQIVRSYLQATSWGTPEEIEDEIYSLQDKGDLDKKANQFKPKLDSMQQQIVNQRIAAQEEANRRRMQQAQVYQDNVYKVLEKGEIAGMKLDNRVQNMLYSGLVQPNYPSVSGKQTNLLGHLLEKYQFVEPRHDLIAEALWLLADPDGYREELRNQGSTTAINDTARKLKIEQQNISGGGGSHQDDSPENNTPARKPAIPRQTRNFFGR